MSDFSKILRLNRFVCWMCRLLSHQTIIAIHSVQPFKPQNSPSNRLHIFLEIRDRKNWFSWMVIVALHAHALFVISLYFLIKHFTYLLLIVCRHNIFIVQTERYKTTTMTKKKRKKNWWKEQRNHFSCSSKAINSVGRSIVWTRDCYLV